MIQTLKVTRRDFVTLKEDRRTDGFCEIGVYVDPVLPGAGLILTAVISKQAGRGCKWCVYPYNGPTRRFTRKGAAYDYAAEVARASDAGKIHLTRTPVAS